MITPAARNSSQSYAAARRTCDHSSRGSKWRWPTGNPNLSGRSWRRLKSGSRTPGGTSKWFKIKRERSKISSRRRKTQRILLRLRLRRAHLRSSPSLCATANPLVKVRIVVEPRLPSCVTAATLWTTGCSLRAALEAVVSPAEKTSRRPALQAWGGGTKPLVCVGRPST